MNPQVIGLIIIGAMFAIMLASAALMTHYAHQDGKS